MKDLFGTELQIGDIVAFNPPSYKGLIKAKILAFTPQKVKLEYEWQRRIQPTYSYPRDVVHPRV